MSLFELPVRKKNIWIIDYIYNCFLIIWYNIESKKKKKNWHNKSNFMLGNVIWKMILKWFGL